MHLRSLRSLIVLLTVCLFTLGLVLLFAAQCVPSEPPPPPPTPTWTVTPSPTPLPTSTPTATPIPPLQVTLEWPPDASALNPVSPEVRIVSPPGVEADVTVSAILFDPQGAAYWKALLAPQGDGVFSTDDSVQLPMDPPDGDWRLQLYLQSSLLVQGELSRVFQPVPIEYRDLTSTLPSGVALLVPSSFAEVQGQGDQVSGLRVWETEGGDIGLWWAPGPTEPLLLNNAIVMLETTYAPGNEPAILSVEEVDWLGQPAFSFGEDWADAAIGASRALVIQSPNYWLYVLRVRALGGAEVPYLVRQVSESFQFEP